jgi:tetratricopeptide (TPR) repeat protein
VRAGLRPVAAVGAVPPVGGHPLEVRVGSNTGEALVRLDITPGSGEGFLTGDAVNVGARLEAAAPPMGVVVGSLTHELTRKGIVYEALEPVAAKGKREPLEVWLAKEPVARTGAQALAWATPFVGRSVELGYLTALLDKAADSSSSQVALIVGEPGIGKSRLIAHLFAQVDVGPRLVTWRQGRCLSYGEGVTFWPLVEIVRSHAGILESDHVKTVEEKLEQVLPDGDDRPWFRQRLRALLGLDAVKAEREENFTAWLRFLEEIASRGPTVIVLEDLHWADDALLDFVEFLALRIAHVPLMVIASARSELFERRPSFGGAVRINRMALEPLSQQETEEIVVSVIDEIAGDLKASIAGQAQGNPFYAEECARLVRDRIGEGAPPLASSVRAIIAARLDALPPKLKRLLSDAAVVGDVFWDGLLATMEECEARDVARSLESLMAKQLVYRVRSSSMAGESEYSFSHSLAREVAYGQLPRLERAKKHAAVAGWIEKKESDRSEEFAEILAHHYATAIDLARAAGETKLADSLLESTIDYLALAGSRALSVDVAAAERHYARAIDLAGPSTDERSDLLCGWARVLNLTQRHRECVAAWEKAIEQLRETGERRKAAAAICELGFTLETLGEPFWELGEQALDLLADDGPSQELVDVLTIQVGAGLQMERLTPREGIEAVDRILEMCAELGLPESARALRIRGEARVELGDAGGLEDFDRALAAAKAHGMTLEFDAAQYNYTFSLLSFRGARAALEATLQGLEVARQRGDQTFVLAFRSLLIVHRYFTGDWDDALRDAESVETALRETEDNFDLFVVQTWRALMLVARGEPDEASVQVERLLAQGRADEHRWVAAYSLITASVVNAALGQSQVVAGLLHELRDYRPSGYDEVRPVLMRTALGAHDWELASLLVEEGAALSPLRERVGLTCRALLEEAREEHEAAVAGFAAAAADWNDFGFPHEEAQALLGQGRCLVALGRAQEAAAPLAMARDIFARLGARPALADVDLLRGGGSVAPH